MSKHLVAALAIAIAGSTLSGCAVYAPAPYYHHPAVVVEPAPVIVAPAPYYGWGYGHWRRW
jgi:hypothetical protein